MPVPCLACCRGVCAQRGEDGLECSGRLLVSDTTRGHARPTGAVPTEVRGLCEHLSVGSVKSFRSRSLHVRPAQTRLYPRRWGCRVSETGFSL